MIEFALALLAFLSAHAIPATPIKPRLVQRLGNRAYLAGYALASLGLLAWLIAAAQAAPYVPLWHPPLELYWLPLALMLPAFILLTGIAEPNPLSLSLSRRAFDPQRPGLVAVTRHPVLWGFALWGLSHAVANGDLVGVILFGGLAGYALAGMALLGRRKRRDLGAQEWRRLSGVTSTIPFAAILAGRAQLRWRMGDGMLTFGGGALLYALLLWAHPRLFSVDPMVVLP